MIKLKDEGVVLERTNLPFESQAVLNPACIESGGILHMYYRAVRAGNFSTIGYAQFKDGKMIMRLDRPLLFPEFDYEMQGLEDPRIVFLDGTYYLFYTAYDGKNARIAYATSTDLLNFQKKGLVSPAITYDKAEDYFRNSNVKGRYSMFEAFYKDVISKDVLLWEKDASLFPKKIGGKFALVHRVLPGIQIIFFEKFSDLTEDYWRNYFLELDKSIVLDPVNWFESWSIGGGCPPIETDKGWLLIYHAVEDCGPNLRRYHAAAALLDLKNPLKVLGRLKEPLFSPESKWEKEGDVNNVVFPTGAVIKNGRVYIYYGAADKVIGLKSADLDELLKELLENPVSKSGGK